MIIQAMMLVGHRGSMVLLGEARAGPAPALPGKLAPPLAAGTTFTDWAFAGTGATARQPWPTSACRARAR